MIEPAELLTHASRLANSSAEVDRRRAVSAAYYALFHTMAWSAARLIAGSSNALAAATVRAVEHKVVANVSQGYVNRKPKLGDLRLTIAAEVFIELQSARYEADYDLSTEFNSIKTSELVGKAAPVILSWPVEVPNDEWREFLVKILLGARLGRRG